MRTISLRRFRDRVADLDEPVAVQRRESDGSFRVLGEWHPRPGAASADARRPAGVPANDRPADRQTGGDIDQTAIQSIARMTQAERDTILKKANRRSV